MTKAKPAKPKAVKPKDEKPKKITYVYVGPSIDGVAKHGDTYLQGAIPERLADLAKDNASVRELIVPLSEQPRAEKEINLKNGYYWEFFKSSLLN